MFAIIIALMLWVDYEKTKRERLRIGREQQIQSSRELPQEFYTAWFYNFLRSND